MGSINAQIGKIAGLQIAERGGRRLKAVLSCAAWFAQERPLRGGRVFRRYPETSAYGNIRMRVVPRTAHRYRGFERVQVCTNAGGTAEGWPFVPEIVGTEGFFVVTKYRR